MVCYFWSNPTILEDKFNFLTKIELGLKSLNAIISILDAMSDTAPNNIITTVNTASTINKNKVKVKRSTVGKHPCQAQTQYGKQCANMTTNQYCAIHSRSMASSQSGTGSTHRSTGNPTQDELNQYYIKTTPIQIGDHSYLIDERDILFSNDSHNTVMGLRLKKPDGPYQWFNGPLDLE
jgi:hypothetical protein